MTRAASDFAVDLTAAISRRLWHLRGAVRTADALNTRLVHAGARPFRVAKLRDGTRFHVDLRARTEWHAFYSARFDDFWVQLGAELLGAGESYLDVGANIGFFAIRVAHLRRGAGPVIAFEPVPENIRRLRENIDLNAMVDVVTLVPFGLSDSDHEVRLSLSGSGGSTTGNAAITEGGEIVAQVVKLDDHPDMLGTARVGVVKVDIEGHEIHFFRGARQMLARDRPFIIAEFCRDFLREAGLSPEAVYRDALPDSYAVYRERNHRLEQTGFDALKRLDNILLCPVEKAGALEQIS